MIKVSNNLHPAVVSQKIRQSSAENFCASVNELDREMRNDPTF